MSFAFLKTQTAKKALLLIPEMDQIVCSNFVNYLNIGQKQETDWQVKRSFFNYQHIFATAYLQSNFKNHIVDLEGIESIKKIQHHLLEHGDIDLLEILNPINKKIPDNHRTNFYIFQERLSPQYIQACQFMANTSFNKIICFPKSQPIQLNRSFEKFCLNHNIKALGLTEFTVGSLMRQINKTTKRSTLLHGLLGSNQIYQQDDWRNNPSELILFLQKSQKSKGKGKKFLNPKKLLKYYVPRDTFTNSSNTIEQNFKILRLQHIRNYQLYSEAIKIQERAMKGESQD